MTNGKKRLCKDCPPGAKRPARFPGPRCFTHDQAVTKARKAAAHARAVQQTYGLLPGEYELLYQFQGGHCWICQRATGASKRLAVDHDHATGDPRGLLCSVCNRFLGHLRDDPAAFRRVAEYLESPPARAALQRLSVARLVP